LLKSMKLVCSGWQGFTTTTELPWRPSPERFPEPTDRKQNKNLTWRQPIRLAHPAQSTRPNWGQLIPIACGLTARCFTDSPPLS